ncbi:putative zinc- or iron-chelating domain [Fragilaria crotonensis]|nr:putative zinc- or iron-chelating domain [Fragilaria crotonensis]
MGRTTIQLIAVAVNYCSVSSLAFSIPRNRHQHVWSRTIVRFHSHPPKQQQSSEDMLSPHNDDNDNVNSSVSDNDAYARALQPPLPQNKWWSSMSSLPFNCTMCGKCCKTKGSVWMSPTETIQAARFLKMSTEAFIQQYASHTLSGDDNEVWIQIKNDPTGAACVFLEDKQCRIYEARPVQCSTYPFWPNIMESEATWDDEVRSTDEDANGPYWTPDAGGCEGMQYIGDDSNSDTTGTLIEEAHLKLEAYEWEERRFPPESHWNATSS